MSASLDHETFSKHLNSTFRVKAEDGETVPLKLSRVSELQLSPRQERFAIDFAGPLQPPLGQGSYNFEHDEMGSFVLFIVPQLANQEGSALYEAVFNRLRQPD